MKTAKNRTSIISLITVLIMTILQSCSLLSGRFSDNKNGTISDNRTGLIWMKNANLAEEEMSWEEAKEYISGLNSGKTKAIAG